MCTPDSGHSDQIKALRDKNEDDGMDEGLSFFSSLEKLKYDIDTR